jgi:esterase/lipase
MAITGIKNLIAVTLILILFPLCSDKARIEIYIENERDLYGTPFSIHITGLSPGETVTLSALSEDASGSEWTTSSGLTATSSGKITLEFDDPPKINPQGTDLYGYLSSMRPADNSNRNYHYDRENGIKIRFTATNSAGQSTSSELVRYYSNPEAELLCDTLDVNGLKGFLYYPDGENRSYPGIILLSGANGGLEKWLARIIASHGYAVLALAYFNYQDLPENLVEIPLEYFERAIEWMKTNDHVTKDRIGLVGGSKGGELVLLLGSKYDLFRVIVAWMPAAHVWQAISLSPQSSWSFNGQGLPYVPYGYTQEDMENLQTGKLTSFRSFYLLGLQNADESIISRAAIPVENIKASILLVSDTDDQSWPSSEFCNMIMQRLAENNFKYGMEHICTQNGGHTAFLPDLIPDLNRNFNGGNPEDQLKANQLIWKATLEQLKKSLK